MKKTLIHTDERKYEVLLAERQRFTNELNEGIQYLKSLVFVSEVSEPDTEDPIGWWHNEIIQTVKPKRIAGLKPNPKQLALSYDVDYDGIIQNINSFPWSASSLIDYVDGEFEVTPKIEEQVREESSTFGTPEQKTEFEKLNVLLNHLNEYCDKYVTDKNDMNNIAQALHCKYVQLPDKIRRIVLNHRVLLHVILKGTTNL